jgi:kynurenine formamidase
LKRKITGNKETGLPRLGRSFFLYKRERKGFTKLVIVFDVSRAKNRDIDIADIDMNNVTNDMFVCFYTGFIEEEGYETKKYFTEHPQLSNELLEALLQKKVSIVDVNFAGVRRGKEHTPMDQYCADHGAFIIENLCKTCDAKSCKA